MKVTSEKTATNDAYNITVRITCLAISYSERKSNLCPPPTRYIIPDMCTWYSIMHTRKV